MLIKKLCVSTIDLTDEEIFSNVIDRAWLTKKLSSELVGKCYKSVLVQSVTIIGRSDIYVSRTLSNISQVNVCFSMCGHSFSKFECVGAAKIVKKMNDTYICETPELQISWPEHETAHYFEPGDTVLLFILESRSYAFHDKASASGALFWPIPLSEEADKFYRFSTAFESGELNSLKSSMDRLKELREEVSKIPAKTRDKIEKFLYPYTKVYTSRNRKHPNSKILDFVAQFDKIVEETNEAAKQKKDVFFSFLSTETPLFKHSVIISKTEPNKDDYIYLDACDQVQTLKTFIDEISHTYNYVKQIHLQFGDLKKLTKNNQQYILDFKKAKKQGPIKWLKN